MRVNEGCFYLSIVHMKRVPLFLFRRSDDRVRNDLPMLAPYVSCRMRFVSNDSMSTCRVLTHAPSASAAAKPRPSAMPPDAIYGVRRS